ncbi:MAG: class I SAM-dependent methyltransferase [bacterium]
MKSEISKNILHQVKENYNLCAEEFSATRVYNWQEISVLIEKYIKGGMKVLDAGCGNGRICELLEDRRVDYIGIDNSEELIREAKENQELRIKNYELRIGREAENISPAPDEITAREQSTSFVKSVKFKIGDILDLPFADSEFNVVLCIAVLHHIPSKELRKKAMGEIYRVLKHGGILIMTNWNLYQKNYIHYIYEFTIKKLLFKNKMDFGDIMLKPFSGKGSKRYHHAFTKRGIKKLMQQAGFRLDECYYAGNGSISNWREGRNLVAAGKKV